MSFHSAIIIAKAYVMPKYKNTNSIVLVFSESYWTCSVYLSLQYQDQKTYNR